MTASRSDHQAVRAALAEIVATWRDRRPREVLGLVDPGVVMRVPGFEGASTGAEALAAGFVEFCETARVHEFRSDDVAIDVVGDVAVTVSHFEMVYERESVRWLSTGKDLWVFRRRNGAWIAVWRTMLDLEESPAPAAG